jgi:mycothiol system anti-sigma-R factor
MDCIKVSQHLHDYLDGEVGRIRRQGIARHLDTCAACSAGFRFEAHFRQLLPGKLHEEPPGELRDRVLRALGEAPRRAEDFTPGEPLG